MKLQLSYHIYITHTVHNIVFTFIFDDTTDSDGVQCTVDSVTDATNARSLKVAIPKQQQSQLGLTGSSRHPPTLANRDTPMYSPALQYKQSNDEKKRKASVRSAMKEISDMLSPVDDSSQCDYFQHADAVMNDNCNDMRVNDRPSEYGPPHHQQDMYDYNDEDMMMQEEVCHMNPSNDPLLALCEAVDGKLEPRYDNGSDTWGKLPHTSDAYARDNQDWVLFGGAVRLSVPSGPVQSAVRSLSLRSHDGVSPFVARNDRRGDEVSDGGMQTAPAATDSSYSAAERDQYVPYGQPDSSTVAHLNNGSDHVASMFPGLLPPEQSIFGRCTNGTNQELLRGTSSTEGHDAKSDVFSDRGETMEALCHFLFAP